MDEPRPYRFKISLRFCHPQADLSACSVEFGLEPFRQWAMGQERTSPRGKPLDGVWGDSYWTAPLQPAPDEDLEAALVRISDSLSRHSQFLTRHAASGGSAALFVGFFLERFNSGFSLEPSVLSKYASLGVALEFDLYGPDDAPGSP